LFKLAEAGKAGGPLVTDGVGAGESGCAGGADDAGMDGWAVWLSDTGFWPVAMAGL